MNESDLQSWFENIWATREEKIYPAFFSDLGPGIYTVSESTFKSIGAEQIDPRYLTHGVFECPPHAPHTDWIYVSSGMSNPWGDSPDTVDPKNFSGLGFEFTMHTAERVRWPIQVMHWVMA